MFGEDSAGESPPTPSPWDSLISISPSPIPPSPIPRLVPEIEEGNVEYKLQLLNPSPARFTRLVTQLKWRLLEGGGQAFYELGVADSGALVGLPRAQLEQSLETLECMAGDIGASVVVVKEIEVPKEISGLAAEEANGWNRKRRPLRAQDDTATTTTDSESPPLCPVDPLDMDEIPVSNLEIASVFKPRPFRTRLASSSASSDSDNQKRNRDKKRERLAPNTTKREARRGARDRKREEKRQALLAYASQGNSNPEEQLVHDLESLHVSVQPPTSDPAEPPPPDDEEDDVFPAVYSPKTAESDDGRRLIVEALVVRKLSLDEAFLDFGGAFQVV